jgi:hypothetical protein
MRYLTVFLFIICSGASEAKCRSPEAQGYVLSNDAITRRVYTDTGCIHGYSVGDEMIFDNLFIVQNPKHGKLERLGKLEIGYRPDRGFSGEDAYTLKVCGARYGKKGCSSITYIAIVGPN